MYIAFGILIYEGIRVSSFGLGVSFVCGCLYIIALGELSYEPYIFKNWSNTAMPVVFYIFPMIYLLLDKMKDFQIKGIGEGVKRNRTSIISYFVCPDVYAGIT